MCLCCCRYVWQSTADGHFSIAEDKGESIGRGTIVNLHLKPEAMEYSDVSGLSSGCCGCLSAVWCVMKPTTLLAGIWQSHGKNLHQTGQVMELFE